MLTWMLEIYSYFPISGNWKYTSSLSDFSILEMYIVIVCFLNFGNYIWLLFDFWILEMYIIAWFLNLGNVHIYCLISDCSNVHCHCLICEFWQCTHRYSTWFLKIEHVHFHCMNSEFWKCTLSLIFKKYCWKCTYMYRLWFLIIGNAHSYFQITLNLSREFTVIVWNLNL